MAKECVVTPLHRARKVRVGDTIQNRGGKHDLCINVSDRDFDQARQKAILLGAAFDFSRVLAKGLYANTNLVWGWDAINPSTRKKAPNQSEYDVTADYRPPFNVFLLQGMWFRFRSAVIDQQDAKQLGYQFRIIVNWDR